MWIRTAFMLVNKTFTSLKIMESSCTKKVILSTDTNANSVNCFKINSTTRKYKTKPKISSLSPDKFTCHLDWAWSILTLNSKKLTNLSSSNSACKVYLQISYKKCNPSLNFQKLVQRRQETTRNKDKMCLLNSKRVMDLNQRQIN